MLITQTFITVKLQVEGIHCWPDAAKHFPEVAFLAEPHRHIFHIQCLRGVEHDDRDMEIILFKRELQDYFKRMYADKNGVCQFGSKSCEMIAKDLLEAYDLQVCEVLEDGENGAVCQKS